MKRLSLDESYRISNAMEEWLHIYKATRVVSKTTGNYRFAAYTSMLQGCAGQTYGAHGIWNLYEAADEKLWDDYHRPDCWQNDLSLPGSMQMSFLRDAFTRVDWPHLEPLPGNIATPQFTHGYLAGLHGRSYIAYVTGRQCDVMLFLPIGRKYQGQWMDCRLDEAQYGSWMRWSAVTPGDGDWVIVLT